MCTPFQFLSEWLPLVFRRTWFLIFFGVIAASRCALAQTQGTLPVVAVHDSELTRALESMAATPPTPSGPGTTGFQWWTSDWHYSVMPDSLKEALRSDGTAFAVVSDSAISGGLLLPNGRPKYPIVISLAAEAIRDDEIARLTNYVAAGGFLFVGSSSFTRFPNGVSRGDFAIAGALGAHMKVPGLANWIYNSTFNRQSGHRLVADIPAGPLTWRMPSYSDEISWGISPSHIFVAPHDLWQVQVSDATILAWGDSQPYVLVKPYGKGWFIYHAGMQPLLGHGGFAPGMYGYILFRRAIEWAFESARLPIPKLSPWPFPYDAALVVRHDLENFQNLVAHVEASAQFEKNAGAKGDYYFCTGTLRQDMGPAGYDTNAVIESLRRSISNCDATVGSHNGGLPNANNPALTNLSYDYWHWGLDEALDTSPPGYVNGREYASASLSQSFLDIESWLSGLASRSMRSWVSPSFNSTREASYDIQAQLGVKIAGDQKLSPFPHWTVSTVTPGKLYPILSQPVSDWFVGGLVAQSLDPWHPPGVHTSATMHEAVDYYYNLGALINFYSHTLSTGEGDAGALAPDYVTYSLNTNLHPRLWSANAIGIYQWWLERSNARPAVLYATNGNLGVTLVGMRGATDSNTTVEVLLPDGGPIRNLQVLLNSLPAEPDRFRANGRLLKLRVGKSIARAQVACTVAPGAKNDFYPTQQGTRLNIAAPGVLANDLPGASGARLSASIVAGPAHGQLILAADGSFAYTPEEGYTGSDSFTYRAGDGLDQSDPATVNLSIVAPGILFADDFASEMDPAPVDPWASQLGVWSVTGGELDGKGPLNSYANASYDSANWTDYGVQARVRFSSASGLGGGIGGRLNPRTGAHYGVWIYPDGSVGGSRILKLIKFQGWIIWSGTPMQAVVLPAVGTNWHDLAVTFQGANIVVNYDGVPVLSATDNGYEGIPAYASGGISADMYTYDTPYTLSIDDVAVSALIARPAITGQPGDVTTNAGANVAFNVAASGPGTVVYRWYKNGLQLLKDGGKVSGASTASLVLSNVAASDSGAYSVSVSNEAGSVTSVDAILTVIVPAAITGQPANVTANSGATAMFAVTVSGTGPFAFQWYKSGAGALANGGNLSGTDTATLVISNLAPADAGAYSVSVSNPAGSVTSSNATLTVVEAPQIVTQPASVSTNAGASASFTVAASGTTPLSYLWSKAGTGPLTNGGTISGATTATLILSNVSASHAGDYFVTVSNQAGSAVSSNTTLTVINPPVITSQPSSFTTNTSASVSFTVGVSGTGPMGYQWRRNGTELLADGGNISGATTAALVLSNLVVANSGDYSVSVSNQAGTVTSSNATLTVLDPPGIVSPPQDRTNLVGSSASFNVVGSGSDLHYQWQFSGADIPGATASEYVRANVQPADAGDYAVVISNAVGHVSSSAHLTVIQPDPASIQTQPQDKTVIAGQNATFAVVATGTAPLGYQWRLNKQDIPGAIASSLVITNCQPSDMGLYSVVVTNAYGSAVSSSAFLTVNFSLTIHASAGGSVLRLPAQDSYAPGSTVVLTAVPASGYGFNGWSSNANGVLNPLIITVNSNMVINANFTPLLGGLLRVRSLVP